MRNRGRKGNRPLAPVFHIFCEGEKTEPNYLDRYRSLFCGNAVSIRIERTKKNTPVQLVEEAVALKKSRMLSPGDAFWVVFDRESPLKYSEKLHEKAREIAKKNGVSIALSNVCFEVWLLLHKQRSCAPCNTCAELIERDDFRKNFPHYEKGSPCCFTASEINSARENATRMNEQTIKGADKSWIVPSKWNPYTNVHELLNAIDDFYGKEKCRKNLM